MHKHMTVIVLMMVACVIFQAGCSLATIGYTTPVGYIPGVIPVRKATDEQDLKAKALAPPSGKCLVYFVNKAPTWFISGIDCYINRELIGRIGSKNYLYAILEPGKTSFVTTSFDLSEKRRGVVELQLVEGRTYYLEQVFDNCDRIKYKKFQLIELSNNLGKKNIENVFLTEHNWKEEKVPNLRKLADDQYMSPAGDFSISLPTSVSKISETNRDGLVATDFWVNSTDTKDGFLYAVEVYKIPPGKWEGKFYDRWVQDIPGRYLKSNFGAFGNYTLIADKKNIVHGGRKCYVFIGNGNHR